MVSRVTKTSGIKQFQPGTNRTLTPRGKTATSIHLVPNPFHSSPPGANGRTHWYRFALVPAVLTLLVFITAAMARAQSNSAESLASRSAIVVSGKVLRTKASDEPLVAASSRTAVISVQRMYAGKEIVGDQMGRIVTVILSRAERLRVGDVVMVFGNPLFIGRTLTIADEGEILAKTVDVSTLSNLQLGVQARTDKPVLDRLAIATLVFRGSVEAVGPLIGAAERSASMSVESQEHDPQWQIATVRVSTPLHGGRVGQTVTLIFAGSRDIVWFNAPKLKAGQDAVFIAHAPSSEERALYRASGLTKFLEKQPAYLVTEPSDVLPPANVAHVRSLLLHMKETR